MLLLCSVVLPEKVCHMLFLVFCYTASKMFVKYMSDICSFVQLYSPKKSIMFCFFFIQLHSLKKVCQIYVPLFNCTAWKSLLRVFSFLQLHSLNQMFVPLFSCTAWKVPVFSLTAWKNILNIYVSCVQLYSLKKFITCLFLCSVVQLETLY